MNLNAINCSETVTLIRGAMSDLKWFAERIDLEEIWGQSWSEA